MKQAAPMTTRSGSDDMRVGEMAIRSAVETGMARLADIQWQFGRRPTPLWTETGSLLRAVEQMTECGGHRKSGIDSNLPRQQSYEATMPGSGG